MSKQPVVRLALPWLRDVIEAARQEGALPDLPALGWLVGRSETRPAPPGDWRQWLVEAVDPALASSLRNWPAGPSLAAATGTAAGVTHTWAVAQPVNFAAGLDHVRLAPLGRAAPRTGEAEQLAATLREHFAGDELEIVDFVDGAWLVRCASCTDCRTHDPSGVAGRDIHDFMPAGADGARVRSLMNEIQMLLHEHPVNLSRARAGEMPINGLWPWGFGTFSARPQPVLQASRWTLHADDLWLRSFWRAHGGTLSSGEKGAAFGAGHRLLALTHPAAGSASDALIDVDTKLLHHACHAVRRGALRRLEIHDGRQVHTLDERARFRFWRRPVAAGQL